MKASRFFLCVTLVATIFASCRSMPPSNPPDATISSEAEFRSVTASPDESAPADTAPLPAKAISPIFIMSAGSVGPDHLVSFFMRENPDGDPLKVERMASYYWEEGLEEGVCPEIAFAQMCLETGFLRFGGLVTEDMNNFCGLGSLGANQSGNSFPDERTGVRAHIQHLKGYATTEPLAKDLVDVRYRYINPKGKAPTIYGLAGTWASDPRYGEKLDGMLSRLFS